MADKLIRLADGVAVAPNETIVDALGRDCWQFYFAARDGVVGTKPEIFVKRVTNGRAAKTPVSFSPDFFPLYAIDGGAA